MKKVLTTIVVILGLAGLANATWLENFESYSDGDSVAGSNGWLAGGVVQGDWEATAPTVAATAGINGTKGVIHSDKKGVHKNVSASSGTTTLNVLFYSGFNDKASIALGAETYGTGGAPSEVLLYLDFANSWRLDTVIGGSWTNYGGSSAAIHSPVDGWYEVEISVNHDDDSGYAKYRFVDDDGDPSGSWVTIGTVSAGSVADTALVYYSIGTNSMSGPVPRWDALVDGDATADGFVGGADITRISTNWGLTSATRSQGDLDASGTVGAGDYNEVLSNWGNGTVPSEPPEAPGATPEPSTLLVLTAGTVLLAKLRRRSRKAHRHARGLSETGGMAMKKLLTIVVVLALAGVANATWLDDFEDYSEGDSIAGTNDWLAGGIGGGDWVSTGLNTSTTYGLFGGSMGVGSPSWRGNHKNVSISTGSISINVLFHFEVNDRGSMMLGQETYGTGAAPSEGLMLDYSGGWYLSSVESGTSTIYGGTTGGLEALNWHEVQLTINLDDDSGYARYRDVDDTTGAPSGSWTDIGIPIPAGEVGSGSLVYYGIGTNFGAAIDGLNPNSGDVNLDGFVGGEDISTIVTNWGMSPADRSDGDLDDSDTVGASDYNQVLDNWGSDTSEPPEPPGAIPEPATLLILAGAVLAGLIRRRTNRIDRILTGFLLVALLAAPNIARATTTFELRHVSSGIPGYERTYDIWATTDGTLGAMEMIFDTNAQWSIYQSEDPYPWPLRVPDDPPGYESFASYVTFSNSIGPAEDVVTIFGGAVDLTGGNAQATWTTQNLDVAWVPVGGNTFYNGTFHVGRITLADSATGSYTITGYEGLGVQATTINGTIVPMLDMSVVPVGGAPSGYKTYDFYADLNADMGPMELRLETYYAGDIYQNNTAWDDGNEAYATYVTIGSSGENPSQTQVFGGAVDLGGTVTGVFDTNQLDVTWAPTAGTTTGTGSRHIARVTLHEDAQATWTIAGWQAGDDLPVTVSGTIDSPVTISMTEVAGAPSGYKAYDIKADVSTNMGAMQLKLETYHAGDIYHNSLVDDPDVGAETYDTYVTVGSGSNPSSTAVLGGAVDLGGGATYTFTNDSLDIAWTPTSGSTTGRGEFQIARVVLHEDAQATWTVAAFQDGANDDVVVKVSDTIDSPVTLTIVDVTDAGTPARYLTHDFLVDISTDMGALELIFNTNKANDIYQNTTSDDPDVGVEDYDTYVTIGGGPNPSSTQILGGAVDISGSITETFDNQNIDITWLPVAGTTTGRAQFQILRITLKDRADGTWSLKSWQAGANDDVGVLFEGIIDNGDISITPPGDIMVLPGDVNGDGLIDSADLSVVIANWGKRGLGWAGGDLNGNNVVDGPDYAEVLSFWAPAEPSEAGVPEPATIALLLAGTIFLAGRRRRTLGAFTRFKRKGGLMKTLLTIVLVLGLAGLANAEFLDTFESYADGDSIAGTNGWLAGGVNAGDWVTTGYRAATTVGIGGSMGVQNIANQGIHKDVSQSSGTVTVNLLVWTETGDRASIALGAEAYGTGAWPTECLLYLDYQNTWSLNTVIDDSWENYGTSAGLDSTSGGLGWYEIELSANLDDDSGYAKYRVVDDTTGAPTSGWTTIGTVSAGSVADTDLVWYGFGSRYSPKFDGLVNPSTSDPGDVNLDGLVGGLDLNRVIGNWGMSPADRSDGDLDDNDTVGATDYNQVLNNWGTTYEPPEPSGAIPEPTTLLILLGGLVCLTVRRRERSSIMLTVSRKSKVLVLALIIALIAPLAWAGVEDLDRGHRLLLDYGLQLQAGVLIEPDDLNVAQYTTSKFTTHHFINSYWTADLAGPPTRPWSRWGMTDAYGVDYDTTYLVMASAHDEDLLDPGTINTYTNWLEGMRDKFPQVISHTTQWAGDNTYAQVEAYMASGNPDLLFMDYYQFGEENLWDGGSPTYLYNEMGKYRTLGLAGNDGTGTTPIPVGQWIQTYKAVNNYALSESELALQYYGSWAYGYKALGAFVYASLYGTGSVSSVLFDGPNDTNPNSLFTSVTTMNTESLNMATSLLRLVSTDLSFVRGLHDSAVTNDLPSYTQDWSSGAGSDAYLDTVVATYSGTLNGGQRGDVLVAHMEVLDEDFDGSATDQLYFMIVNGLTDSNGTSDDTEQAIRLDFDFGSSGITQLQRIDRTTGKVVDVALTSKGGHRYYVILNLDGGEGDLFKYDTGARFVGLFDGDVNDDGFVGASDINRIVTNWGMTSAERVDGDLDDSGAVGAADYNEVLNNWGTGVFPSEPPEPPGATPEPSTLLVLLSGWALLRRRGRRSG